MTTLVDPPIDSGLAQRVGHGSDRRRRLDELVEDAGRLPLLEVTADLEHEGRVGPHRRPAAPGHEHQGNEAGAGYRDSGHDENENEHNAASYSHVKPPVF